MTDRTALQQLQARLDQSMPTMAELCTSEEPELFRSLLARMGDKWTLLVIGVLGDERRRFTELSEVIPGISRRMLTVTLRALERDGLVSRTVHAEVPPRVEYELTALGWSLQSVALALADWVREHQEVIVGNRQEFDGDVGDR
ncbi:helix-turn-helix transcriptional regulator [Curtobacterium sp. YC1]|uniref:winged helix-turn-helix transcriptional regulator n=1 Tax=Curtobacterium sp. YC1 TaxID=2795488 RepID=UPI0018E53FCF|nr:helix-turn-helix domain-containing protein [Curtobacterium sp. YC1]QQD76177.1 helix-turn-helix transcriptional regulator [Curtobacterium sp. YC1]